ncbi:hypothetical protein BDQ17DRAFT_1425104 [Cyathus striatus]|nr:hypothetical protein BDQ17DRAFT_1425104 [Cyathus striatus]
MVKVAESITADLSTRDEDNLTSLTCTAITLAVDDFSAIHSLPEVDSDHEEVATSEDYANICTAITQARTGRL